MIESKKRMALYIGLIVIVAIGIFLIFARKEEDTWLCVNGQWVMHGKPSAQKPTGGCGSAAVPTSTNLNPANISYTIEGKAVALTNSQAAEPNVPDSASKTVTKIFEANIQGDINGDGLKDTAVILTQSSGGSGTFYYIAAAIKTAQGYIGTNAVLLGDRIAPQTTEIKNGMLIENYADRKTGESFSIAPSVGKSLYLEYLNNALVARPEAVQVESPYPYAEITSPLKITGQARGTWFFEASFPVTLTDQAGKTIAQGQAKATGDWMTENFVPFTATLNFTAPAEKGTGIITLKKDNPSGLPQNGASYEIPVKFK